MNDGSEKFEQLFAKIVDSTEKIKALDKRYVEVMKEVEETVEKYALINKSMPREEKMKKVAEIDAMYEKAENLARRKYDISKKLYNSIDGDIQTMDEATKKLKLEKSAARRARKDATTPDGARPKKHKKKIKTEENLDKETDDHIEDPGNVDMPPDPNEPIYCTCHQVSFGEMVGCDNDDCKIEWFHFQCVGLTVKVPNNVKWYCVACRPAFKHISNQWNYETNEPPTKSRKPNSKG